MNIKSKKETVAETLWGIGVSTAFFLVLITFVSLWDSNFWFIRALHFPRIQIFFVLGALLLVFSFYKSEKRRRKLVIMASIFVAICIQAYYLFPYLTIADKSIADAVGKKTTDENQISILLSNVLMKNKGEEKVKSLIEEIKPNMVLLMEVNRRWMSNLCSLKESYPYQINFPAENAYGMALWSKFPLSEAQTYFFNHDSIPSFLFTLEMPTGKKVKMLTFHPVAPKPSKHVEDVDSDTLSIVKAARLINEIKGPMIVAGDFNEVAWSQSSKVFENTTTLHDLRRGRGFYNSFNAQSFFWRWPLDYVYVSKEFSLIEMRRERKIGSDHYPFFVRLQADF